VWIQVSCDKSSCRHIMLEAITYMYMLIRWQLVSFACRL
jgi:hypothetical protein